MYTLTEKQFTDKVFDVSTSEKELIDNVYYSWEKNIAQKSISGQRNEEKDTNIKLELSS